MCVGQGDDMKIWHKSFLTDTSDCTTNLFLSFASIDGMLCGRFLSAWGGCSLSLFVCVCARVRVCVEVNAALSLLQLRFPPPKAKKLAKTCCSVLGLVSTSPSPTSQTSKKVNCRVNQLERRNSSHGPRERKRGRIIIR